MAATTGLIELGFGAKAGKSAQDGLPDRYKGIEAFMIIAGGFSLFTWALKTVLFKSGGTTATQ